MSKRFLIYVNQFKDQELKTTKRIEEYLKNHGQEVCLLKVEKDWKQGEYSAPDFPKDVDVMLVLGGDGTVLQAARETIHSRIPLIGVNLGSLGFMTQIEPTGIEVALDRLIDGDYREESRMLLQGKASLQGGVTKEGLALNDIVITRSGALRVILLRIYVNGSFLHEYQADGMIITTPTGSTGYNLSAGGPLVEPGAKLLMLTPICPHSLNHRSIILSSEDEIEIEIPLGKEGKEQKVEASLDGGNSFTMVTGDRITIKKSQESARFLQLSSVSFLETLHQKMKD
ncbi:MAG: NAD(+)/NADH kinase [Lachnospiraceae bacterium]|nr:NAD(+)/NADH kinase [Lachnospiraceae bacterium]MBQ3907440.1 NAD(+)/NADH kinase [Lachnospiraceae bacterium]MCR4598820.1 NAD(+)/NADH kinase [Acetatifactor sp.]